ncbi:alanine and glycine-rich protein-like [Schistocerca nitens]|uniref:alanine and glycine-rich protein-like n=1 Tax=Schistocerca nitens TaxID=7011 RepID=UPI002118B2DE|nr:alanine and glycine-rich protein-like [Schistocerca nitens]
MTPPIDDEVLVVVVAGVVSLKGVSSCGAAVTAPSAAEFAGALDCSTGASSVHTGRTASTRGTAKRRGPAAAAAAAASSDFIAAVPATLMSCPRGQRNTRRPAPTSTAAGAELPLARPRSQARIGRAAAAGNAWDLRKVTRPRSRSPWRITRATRPGAGEARPAELRLVKQRRNDARSAPRRAGNRGPRGGGGGGRVNNAGALWVGGGGGGGGGDDDGGL